MFRGDIRTFDEILSISSDVERYNPPHRCRSPLGQNSTVMKFSPCWVQAEWAKSIAPMTRS